MKTPCRVGLGHGKAGNDDGRRAARGGADVDICSGGGGSGQDDAADHHDNRGGCPGLALGQLDRAQLIRLGCDSHLMSPAARLLQVVDVHQFEIMAY